MRLLVVENQTTLAEQLVAVLSEAGYAVDVSANGEEAAHLGRSEPYDAVILDLGLPQRDGLSILRDWRAAGIAMPVLVLTARAEWHEKVDGIDAGADDYLANPFRMEELLARMRAVLRRPSGAATSVLTIAGIALDTRSARVSVDGRPVRLTGHEYRVLAYLMHHAGAVISRSELIEHIDAQDYDQRLEYRRGVRAAPAPQARCRRDRHGARLWLSHRRVARRGSRVGDRAWRAPRCSRDCLRALLRGSQSR